jgi:prolycopene isomerase
MTFTELIDDVCYESKKVNSLVPSASAFIVYLGLNKKIKITPKHYTTYFFTTYDLERCYNVHTSDLLRSLNFDYLLCAFSSVIDPTLAPEGKSTLGVFTGAQFKSKIYWDKKREKLNQTALEKLNKIIPVDRVDIEVNETAIPHTFSKFTSNEKGAIFGWAARRDQLDRNLFPPETSIENLYLAGHWVMTGVGQSSVSLVALCGSNTAKLIFKKKRSNHSVS